MADTPTYWKLCPDCHGLAVTGYGLNIAPCRTCDSDEYDWPGLVPVPAGTLLIEDFDKAVERVARFEYARACEDMLRANALVLPCWEEARDWVKQQWLERATGMLAVARGDAPPPPPLRWDCRAALRAAAGEEEG